jgi:hypothetical protein
MQDAAFPLNGSIAVMRCSMCGASVARFEIETETDVGGVGFCSGGLCNDLDVVVGQLDLREWTEFERSTSSHLPARIAQATRSDSYRVLRVLRIEQPEPPPAGVSFQEFRRLYKRPVVIYRCPCCGDGEGKETEMTMDAFRARGGRLRFVSAPADQHG